MEYKDYNFPDVKIDKKRTTKDKLYLIINKKAYPTRFDQVSIINTIDLISDDDIIFYSVDGNYFTAKEFRTAYGFKNTFFDNKMDWTDIVFELLDDPMIQSCGCDGLLDANNVLKGLLSMSELLYSYEPFNDEFILESINASIKARNRYCWMNSAKKLEYVTLENGEFKWSNMD